MNRSMVLIALAIACMRSASADELHALEMEGPYASIDAHCPVDGFVPEARRALPSGVQRVGMFLRGCDAHSDGKPTKTTVTLAVKTARGWYSFGAQTLFNDEHRVERLKDAKVARRVGGTELLWTFDVDGKDGVEQTWSRRYLVIVVLSASREPVTSSTITLFEHVVYDPYENSPKRFEFERRRAIKWDAGRATRFTITGEKGDVEAGQHALVFP